MQGETLRLICKSQGFPIRSSVIRQNNGQEVCPPIDSSANLVLVGQAAFGQLHHTCDITALQPGEHRFVCQVDFLPWEDNLEDFGTVTEAIQCSVLQGEVMLLIVFKIVCQWLLEQSKCIWFTNGSLTVIIT